MASVLSEYLKLFAKYSEQYGEKTAVLMQVGHFMEVYGIDNNKEEKIGNAVELSKILNIVLTRKNKKIAENNFNNPLMLGFPCLALNKYVPVLLENNYTIVVVEQVKTSLSIKRVVADVISPSTYIDGQEQKWTEDYLAMIYVDAKSKSMGLTAMSVITGKSVAYECYPRQDDADASLDEAIGFLKKYRPREVVVAAASEVKEDLLARLELDTEETLCHFNDINKIAFNVEYQNAVLGTVFKHNTMLSNIEYVDLERSPCALVSYVLLIEFVYCHNPMLLRKVSPPDIYVPSNQLVLATNTVDQLNVVSKAKGRKDSLFSIINKCSTSMGNRLLLRRLLNPIFDAGQLEARYQRISDFGNVDVKHVEKILDGTLDVERLQRRMSVGIMTPNELAGLVSSYESLLKLDSLLKDREYDVVLDASDASSLEKFVSTCKTTFIMENMSTCNIESPNSDVRIFQDKIFEEIDALYRKMSKEMDKLVGIAGEVSEDAKVEYMQNVGYYISIGNIKAKKAMLKVGDRFAFRSNKTSTRVTNDSVEQASKRIQAIGEDLKCRTRKRYDGVIRYLLASYSAGFDRFVSFASEVDVVKSLYKISTLYNYCRPVIDDTGPSFVEAKGLRHPIIERIDDGAEYVTNDLSIGQDYNGIVLYSMNACGKTSLLKACGLSVVLAQIGCYVPAKSYRFRPFRCMMTRILSEDNMMKGQSSFVAEMSELRAILKRAQGPSTLVLADEITHGTEHTSGSSIFVSSVETLADRKVNFMFTTHLHNVYPFVDKIENVRVFHLSVKFDDTIVFERKLADGPGNSVYGLEVCKFLNMDEAFLTRAFHIRNMITPDKTEPSPKIKTSRYNRNKIVQNCEICGYSKRTETDMYLDVHHVQQKSLADCNGMIDTIHKNCKSNLVTLCKSCHVEVHKGQIEIFGYKSTTQGMKLRFTPSGVNRGCVMPT